MAKFELTSTCDDAGNMLAARLNDSSFVRVVESHETREAAEQAKSQKLAEYKAVHVAIGEGCLSVRESV